MVSFTLSIPSTPSPPQIILKQILRHHIISSIKTLICIWEIRIFSFPFPPYNHNTMITPKKMNSSDSSTLPCIRLILSFSFSHRCFCTLGLCELGSEQGSHLGDSCLSLWIYSNFASSFFPLPFICGKLRSFVPSSYSGFAWLYPSNVLLHSLYYFWPLLFMAGAVYHVSRQ